MKEKIEGTNLYFFFKKTYNDTTAHKLSQMVLFKNKYNVNYSDDQEEFLKQALFTRKKH